MAYYQNMNRIDQKFKELNKRKKKAFIAFITAGDPSLAVTEQLVLALEKAGADIVELGVPFSDPLADGPTIQASSQRALQKGVSLNKILNLVASIRRKSKIPIALMTYYNPVFHFGEREFINKAKQAGVDGIIVPDLPAEEAGGLIKLAKKSDIATIFFIAPTTTTKRIKQIVKKSTGFIYYVSLTGVTGARRELPKEIVSHVRLVKRLTRTPVCVGFGVSTPVQVKAISRFADGVIVGSAIVNEIAKNSGKKNLVSRVVRFVAQLTEIRGRVPIN